MSNYGIFGIGSLGLFGQTGKRRVFVSYHHGGDQAYYNAFVRTFAGTHDVFSDTSVDRQIESDKTEYIRWKIYQDNIKGSSCSIVLCGSRTHERKYVDWEIHYTLEMQHGLIGVWLPTLPLAPNGGTQKPARLQDNIDSRYAKWLQWRALTPDVLKSTIEAAIVSPAGLIRNERPLRGRNG
jgi:hypothetical protein